MLEVTKGTLLAYYPFFHSQNFIEKIAANTNRDNGNFESPFIEQQHSLT
jgi:hypothetical protein